MTNYVCVYIWLNIFLSKNGVILTPNYEPFCINDLRQLPKWPT